jgi:hypothetical protein
MSVFNVLIIFAILIAILSIMMDFMAYKWHKKSKFWSRWRKADIGDKTNEKGRPFQKFMRIIQDIIGLNVLSFGILGSWLESFFRENPNSWLTHIFVSILAMIVIIFIRKLIAFKTGYKYTDKELEN